MLPRSAMVEATHLKAAYSRHANEMSRRYATVTCRKPTTQVELEKGKQKPLDPSKKRRAATQTTLAATGPIDLYA